MFNGLRHSAGAKFLWVVFALYLLNISVDVADRNPDHLPEDLSFNDQESIVEIIVEKVMGFENAFAEYDDHDSEGDSKLKNVKVDFLGFPSRLSHNSSQFEGLFSGAFSGNSGLVADGYHKLESPPPKS